MNTRANQGNVLFIILIAIVLFASLTYAVTRTTQTGSNVDTEQNALAVGEVLQYVSSLRTAVAQIIAFQPNFDITTLSFENDLDAGYNNPNCTDGSCKVFDAAGGGLNPHTSPPPGINDGSAYIYSSRNRVEGVGDNSPSGLTTDLILLLPNVTQAACEAFNTSLRLDVSSIPQEEDNTIGTAKYAAGSWPPGGGSYMSFTDDLIVGEKAACFELSSGTYYFYAVIKAN
tara:strand:- start:332 stop:1018 length:687 start_codon:yes stop_codon:yes gene_type:complete